MISFPENKHLTYIKQLGKGGTGTVHLVEDAEIGKQFAIKKYTPPAEKEVEYYKRFVEEIKILIDLYHPNIVRCYTYYLYPNLKTGYLQMEYIEGDPINLYLDNNPLEFDKLFRNAVDAFCYLETNNILHRDIRPSNFLVSNGQLKIIDFGFSKDVKQIQMQNEEASIILNWPVTNHPDEIVSEGIYNEGTELYYLGSMFKNLSGVTKTSYISIIEKMCQASPNERYTTFFDIKKDINNEDYSGIEFSIEQKDIYLNFTNELFGYFTGTYNDFSLYSDDEILKNLDLIVKINLLEKYVNDKQALVACFYKGAFRSSPKSIIHAEYLIAFYHFLKKVSKEKRTIILLHIRNRINLLHHDIDDLDDLPF